jgi:hypothetical protein
MHSYTVKMDMYCRVFSYEFHSYFLYGMLAGDVLLLPLDRTSSFCSYN